MSRSRMPVYFVPHGAGPCFFMQWNPVNTWDRMRAFLEGIAAQLPEKPKAIVVISGHWLTQSVSVVRAENPALIYDYSGFPPHTYELRYDAPSLPDLADRIVESLNKSGIPAIADAQRGYDHGVFIPLKVMFPEADIPVIPVSLRLDMNPAAHVAIGEALAWLRDEGVLIVGSGMSFHNMRGYGDPRFGPISEEFDQWLTDVMTLPNIERTAAISAWESAPSARLSHPPRAEEHLLPLFVAAGAAGDDAGQKVFSDVVLETTISGFRFG